MDRLIITAALVGAEVTRRDHPRLPITPGEIALAAYEARQAGASVIHLHVRRDDGTPTQDKQIFEETIRLIKEKCDVIIQVSTGGAVGMTAGERLAPITLRPEMASLTAGSINFGDAVFLNQPRDIEHFAREMQACGVKPEVELFDTGMVSNAMRLVKNGLLHPPLHFGLVMGVLGGIPGTAKNLLSLVEALPPGSTWSVAGIGAAQLPLGVMAILLGGHVRVGFEDNIYYHKGVLAESNAQLVERIARIGRELGREVATPDEARAILGLGRVLDSRAKEERR